MSLTVLNRFQMRKLAELDEDIFIKKLIEYTKMEKRR